MKQPNWQLASYILLALLVLVGCNEDIKAKHEVTVDFKGAPERYDVGNEVFYVVQIEGHKYATRYAGGFTHLESCPCKQGLKAPSKPQ